MQTDTPPRLRLGPAAAPAPEALAGLILDEMRRRAGPVATGRNAAFDRLVDALNRLPRPLLMLLAVALFAYAALDPAGFSARMEALSRVPEPLWWLQGAIVTFYFGAREAHYRRTARPPGPPQG